MENDEILTNEQTPETEPETNEYVPAETKLNPEADALPSDIGEEPGNLDICPNCLEPNTENLAVCKYCGRPLHQGADPEAYEMPESEATLAKNRAEAMPEENKPKKKQEGGFRRVMPWLGLYIIYYAITGIIETSHKEDVSNYYLAYGAWAIYIVAGVLMAWPLIMKGYRKLRNLPDPEETEEAEEQATEKTAENAEPAEEPAAEESGGGNQGISSEGSESEAEDD